MSYYGGRLIQEGVPYQPSILFVQPGSEEAPILLDELVAPQNSPVVIQETWDGTCQNCEPVVAATQPQLPPGVRDGVFQKMFFTGAWMPQLEGDSLGWSDLELGVVFGFPLFRRETPLLVTPRFAIHFLEGPVTPDLPGQVYDAEVEFRHLRKFGQGPWAMIAAVSLGHYSDFESNDADAFRVMGQAFAVYEAVPGKKWVLGVVYLNREDLALIPAAGLIYQPNPNIKLEAILPRPRIAWRLPGYSPQPGDERWLYLGGEFGGGVWSIRRPLTLTQDVLTYNDYRALIGCERKIIGGLSRRFEAGYVFGRELQFSSATPDVTLDDSFFLRMGLTY
ncbi:MAG: DUF6268 family outer membrane beta-barrel protein [Pirellulales bacterium]|nr:DUF6268 family outer membrane beta-barrel protein [Pirellulales bacterium]